jgi:hypothetical protein
VPANWLAFTCNFFRNTELHYPTLPIWGGHAGRLDLARSYLIETAKHNPEIDWLISIDTDVIVYPGMSGVPDAPPGISLDRLMEWLEGDRESGWGVINACTLDKNGNPQIGADLEGWAQVTTYEPMVGVNYFAGGFLAISREAIDAIQPYRNVKILGPGGDDIEVPLYCRQKEEETEDSDLCANFKRAGVRLTVDPRIIVGHVKETELYLDPREWIRWRTNAKEALKRRPGREDSEDRDVNRILSQPART